MFKIVTKKELNPTVTKMSILAPRVAKKAQAGQFIILRVDENGERNELSEFSKERISVEKHIMKHIDRFIYWQYIKSQL